MSVLTVKSGTNPHGEIKTSEVTTESGGRKKYTDDAALKLVNRDSSISEQFIQDKQWGLNWREADILYQSPRSTSTFEGTTVTRANVTRFTVATHVNSIIPQLMNGLFYEDPPFVLRPRPGTTEEVIRQKSAVLEWILEMCEFKGNVELGLMDDNHQGTGIWKWGWHKRVRIEKRYVRKGGAPTVNLPLEGETTIPTVEADEFDVKEIEVNEEYPYLEYVPFTEIGVNPNLRFPDIRKAEYVIHKIYMNYYQIEELRSNPCYQLPSEEELKKIFEPPQEQASPVSNTEQMVSDSSIVAHAQQRSKIDSADPYMTPLLVEERTDKDTIIVVLNKKLVIRNDENDFGCINFLSSNWWNVPKSFWGMGVGRLIGQDQRVIQGVTNAALDILSLGVNPDYVVSKSANVQTQPIRSRLGGITTVEGDVQKAFMLKEQPKIPPEVWAAIQNSNATAESATGANELLVQGAMPQQGRTSMGRTATGASNLASASASRLQGPLDRFIEQVFIPFIQKADELTNERMPMQQIRAILGEKMGEQYAREMDAEKFLNAKVKYGVLAGARMAAKKAMAAALPLMLQIFENPQIIEQLGAMGYKVDVKAVLEAMMEVSEWKNTREFIVPMTPQERQALMQMNPGVQKQQMEENKIAHTFHEKQQLQDMNQTALMAREVVREGLKQTLEPQ